MLTKLAVLICGLACFFGLSQTVLGQENEVTYAEVLRMEQSAMLLMRSVPYRSTMTSWVFPERGKDASYTNVLIRETTGPDRWRSIQVNDQPGSFRRMEVITIGDQAYRKVDERPWEAVPLPPPPPPAPEKADPSKPAPVIRFENKLRLVETVNAEGGPVSVYEAVSKSFRLEGAREVARITTNRYWFRYDGRLLRKDMELEVAGEPRILKNSTVYEYDAISIEKPIN